MSKPNAYIAKAVEQEIQRRIQKGELFTLAMVNADLKANCDMLAKMMTIAVNRGVGVGKKRFNEKFSLFLIACWTSGLRTATR